MQVPLHSHSISSSPLVLSLQLWLMTIVFPTLKTAPTLASKLHYCTCIPICTYVHSEEVLALAHFSARKPQCTCYSFSVSHSTCKSQCTFKFFGVLSAAFAPENMVGYYCGRVIYPSLKYL